MTEKVIAFPKPLSKRPTEAVHLDRQRQVGNLIAKLSYSAHTLKLNDPEPEAKCIATKLRNKAVL